jgi:hypothetical protein
MKRKLRDAYRGAARAVPSIRYAIFALVVVTGLRLVKDFLGGHLWAALLEIVFAGAAVHLLVMFTGHRGGEREPAGPWCLQQLGVDDTAPFSRGHYC